MKTLHARFNLVLSLALVIATLLPVLILYLLSQSGLVEATYVTDTRQLPLNEQGEGVFVLDPADIFPIPVQARGTAIAPEVRLPLQISVNSPEDRQEGLNLYFNPVTGLWTEEMVSSSINRIVFSSQVFQFRVDLPAWIVIGALPLFGLAAGSVLSFAMSRSITRPISQLAEGARVIGQRELGYRVQAKGSKEIVDLAQSFNRMAEDLEHAETTRRNLMADIAHELRTPLSVLQGDLRAMLDHVQPMSEDEIALLFEQTHHLKRLVDDLRELSLAEANQLSLNLQTVDLAGLLRETVAYFEPVAQEHGVEFRTEIAEPLTHPAMDENRLRQVVHNLVANALFHTPAGGAITLSARALPEEPSVEVVITDSGEGISMEELPHIFDRFFKGSDSFGRDRDRSGLGLAIARAIVEMLGGTIEANSAGKGQGSAFILHFP